MKTYKAYIGEVGIITVLAENMEDAKDQVKEQLSRPGRYEYLNAWLSGGSIVKSNSDNTIGD